MIINRILNKFKRNVVNVNNVYTNFDKLMINKNVIIVGGTSGIGYAVAKKIKNAGAHVIICGRNNKDLSENYDFYKVDVSNKSMLDVFDDINKKYERIDAIINCQGICPEIDFNQEFFKIDSDDFDAVFNVNLKSVYFLNQFYCNYFINNKIKGHILNICSTEGLKGSIVPYGLSKSGVVSLTKGLGKKMAEYGIIVNGIAPGATATKMMRIKNENLYCNYIPDKRMAQPDEIANLALILVSDYGNHMVGEVAVIDGGESLH